MSIKNDGHYFCRAGGNRPDGLNEPVTHKTGMGACQRHELQCRSVACQCRLPASGHADRPDRLHRRHDGSQ
ncbi:hypothetical protein BU63_07905 [Escherichia coli O118:H16 str. 07-4255]|nr:hypothetical protein BU59_00590 [Escherichia coli O69:H11 str. 07-3763]KDV72490.1 hypothetical protein BU63_07905 [Escherichia coli O118:H16 str. 07-4255]